MDDLTAVLLPDAGRVIVKLFVPGDEATTRRPSRAARLAGRIAAMAQSEVDGLLGETLRRFSDRHDDLESVFLHHYELMRHRVTGSAGLSRSHRQLIGAYFSAEYAVEAAALCNPSMTPHPDQSGLDEGQLRVVISLRQIGEGHLSSIGFAAAVLGPGDRLTISPRTGSLAVGQRIATRHRRDLLAGGLAEAGWDNEVAATVLSLLPDVFDDGQFDSALTQVPADLMSRSTSARNLEQLRRTLASSYTVTFPADVPLERRVLWPSAPEERNGMEDARFTRLADGSYVATYTAYDGREINSRMLISADLRTFDVNPLRGPASAGKGMAFFPREVNGRRLALSRCDGETLGLSSLDENTTWQSPVPLHTPGQGWELIQTGNCGSPLETEAGWLVLTHGVGPMRRYAMSAILLDLGQPEQVIARLPEILLAPADEDRFGYVPNVVYSCGGLIHDGLLWLPYGVGDTRVRFASMELEGLLRTMVESS